MARNANQFGALSTCDICGNDMHSVYTRDAENRTIERCYNCDILPESDATTVSYCAEFVVPWHTTVHVQLPSIDDAKSQFAKHLEAIGYNGPTSDGQCASLLIFAACESGTGHHETITALHLFDVDDSGEIAEGLT